ncbi:MAG: hypothetical protein P8N81_00905 [Paracoccaceae bacterium]|nr:hypothetical protein [Paracoccaceae bacterium]
MKSLLPLVISLSLFPYGCFATEFSFGCWRGVEKMVGVWDDSNKTILLYGNKFSLIHASKDMVQFNLVSSTEHVEILIKADGSYSEKHGDLPWKTFKEVDCILNFKNL